MDELVHELVVDAITKHELVDSLRSRFKEHAPTVQRIVAAMSDDELCQEWHKTFAMRMQAITEWGDIRHHEIMDRA
jgi:hypothetical protein